LRDCGFDIDLICFEDSFARHSDYLDRVLALAPDDSDQTWINTLLSCPGEKLLVGDDDAVDWLLRTTEKSHDLATGAEKLVWVCRTRRFYLSQSAGYSSRLE
jgi:hypothetical protein